MRNKFLIVILALIIKCNLFAENITIQSKNITLDKNTEISIFEKDVEIKMENENKITSDYAEYNKKIGFIKLKNNVIAVNKGDTIKTENAEYNEKTKIFISSGPTEIITSENTF